MRYQAASRGGLLRFKVIVTNGDLNSPAFRRTVDLATSFPGFPQKTDLPFVFTSPLAQGHPEPGVIGWMRNRRHIVRTENSA